MTEKEQFDQWINLKPPAPDGEEEVWVDVEWFDGIYQVSSYGRLRRMIESRLNAFTVPTTAAQPMNILRPQMRAGTKRKRYPGYTLQRGIYRCHVATHQLVAHHFIGPRPGCLVIDHVDEDQLNCFYKNLEYVTNAVNADRFRNNHPDFWDGSNNSMAKVTEADVAEIRLIMPRTRAECEEVGKRFNLSVRTIRAIKGRETWRHV